MKKILISIALLLGMSAFFTSCNKDGGSSSYSKLIIGTWQLDAINYYNDNTLVKTVTSDELIKDGIDVESSTYTFRSDGKVENYKYPAFVQPWSIVGNTLTFGFGEMTIISIDSHKMVLGIDEKTIAGINEMIKPDISFNKVTETFKRIK